LIDLRDESETLLDDNDPKKLNPLFKTNGVDSACRHQTHFKGWYENHLRAQNLNDARSVVVKAGFDY
jgi:hypothetical protein